MKLSEIVIVGSGFLLTILVVLLGAWIWLMPGIIIVLTIPIVIGVTRVIATRRAAPNLSIVF